MKLKYLLTLCLCLIFTPLAKAESPVDSYNQGIDAFKQGDYVKAVEAWKNACNADYINACFNLGLSYLDGQGVQKNEKQASQFMEKSCNHNDVAGCFFLGEMYAKGRGVKQDYAKAVQLLEKACNGGVGESCNNLGSLYLNGLGVKKNDKQANQIFERACENGVAKSCHHLGNAYFHGDGVKQSYTQASKLYEKACNKDDIQLRVDLLQLLRHLYSGHTTHMNIEKCDIAAIFLRICDQFILIIKGFHLCIIGP